MPEAHMCGSKADLDGQQALGGWLATRLIHIGLVAPSSPLVHVPWTVLQEKENYVDSEHSPHHLRKGGHIGAKTA
eukprot:1149475-Pelagomonas_calceolata.AAC.10